MNWDRLIKSFEMSDTDCIRLDGSSPSYSSGSGSTVEIEMVEVNSDTDLIQEVMGNEGLISITETSRAEPIMCSHSDSRKEPSECSGLSEGEVDKARDPEMPVLNPLDSDSYSFENMFRLLTPEEVVSYEEIDVFIDDEKDPDYEPYKKLGRRVKRKSNRIDYSQYDDLFIKKSTIENKQGTGKGLTTYIHGVISCLKI